MAKTSIAKELDQEGSLREGLEAAIRERVREIIEMVLGQEVDQALGAGRSRPGREVIIQAPETYQRRRWRADRRQWQR